jgi:hypothetical protein
MAGLTWVARARLHYPALPNRRNLSVHDCIGVLQLVFASVAGAGALVALVTMSGRLIVENGTSRAIARLVLPSRTIAPAAVLDLSFKDHGQLP